MAIIRWSPIRELEDMRRNLDKLFGEYVEPMSRPHLLSRGETGTSVPSLDILDRQGELVIRMDLPGVDKEHIDLTITKDALTVKADVKKEEEAKQEDYYIRERSSGTYARTVQLPHDADASKAKASCKDGVLEIVLPKKEEARASAVRIDIA